MNMERRPERAQGPRAQALLDEHRQREAFALRAKQAAPALSILKKVDGIIEKWTHAGELRLRCGEMTGSEMRLAKAVASGILGELRAATEELRQLTITGKML